MKTKPTYLDDPYVKEMTAQVIDVIQEREGVWRLILDQTVFYPMGGGQPTDQGKFILWPFAKSFTFSKMCCDLFTPTINFNPILLPLIHENIRKLR